MVHTFRNQHVVTLFHDELLPADRELTSPIHYAYQLVRCTNEIIPLPAGRIGEHVATVVASMSVLDDLFAIKRHRKFLRGG